MMGMGFNKCFPVTEYPKFNNSSGFSGPSIIGCVPWTELWNTCLTRHLFNHQGHLHV